MIPVSPAPSSAALGHPGPGGRRTARLGVAAAVCVFALAGCNVVSGKGSSDGSGRAAGSKGFTAVAKADRVTAPRLTGKTLGGDTLDVGAAYRGKVVVLNVWSSWCAPCRAEAKNLAAVSRQLRTRGARFVGINTGDPSTGPALAFEKSRGVPYPSLYDPQGRLLLRFPAGSLSPQAIPSTVVVDREGRIAARASGGVSVEQLHAMVGPLLSEK
ncbi:TlpA family protein disulfide reductase [Streptomyces sp. NPDC059398]|uniref:TlpA family protein disulfide reductase n=1 Tax=Streptomyces sp. NPDC059398 TaxID=3346820 RepID=UPI0036D147BE